MKEGIGRQFQKETKYLRGLPPAGYIQRAKKPSESQPLWPKIKLPSPDTGGGMPLWEAIKNRRSIRNFKEVPLKTEALSQLLWASQGITEKTSGFGLRAAPSAGALYPLETYLGIFNVEGVPQGVYHYVVKSHVLERLSAGDLKIDFAEASLEQDFIASANVIFIWTAVFERSKRRYKERAYRYVYLDAGHIAQNTALAAVALGLGTCQIGALYDDEINALVGADGIEESVLYMTVVGYPR